MKETFQIFEAIVFITETGHWSFSVEIENFGDKKNNYFPNS